MVAAGASADSNSRVVKTCAARMVILLGGHEAILADEGLEKAVGSPVE